MKPLARKLLFLGSSLVGVVLLGVICAIVDLPAALRELVRIGVVGCAVFLVNIAISLGGPMLGWHLLMRSAGIPVRFRTTLASFLMGRAFNLISPMAYFGGESVRTFHIAAVTGSPKRQALSTIVVSELQLLAALTLFTLGGLGVAAAGGTLSGARLAWAAAGAAGLAVFLAVLGGLTLGDVRLSVRILDLLIRCGIFPRKLASVRQSAVETEQMIRSLMVDRRRAFFLSQMACLLSPVAQFFRPTLFFALLARAGGAPALPTLSELAVFFVLSQLIFMMPSTPGGIGVYEGGVIGVFRLLGWDAADGAAYGVLLRLDDLFYVLFGWTLIARFGMSRWLSQPPEESSGPGGPDALEARVEPGLPVGVMARPVPGGEGRP